jgi:hypothetical protein
LEETSHSRESLIEALRNRATLPSAEVALATFYVEDIEQDIPDVPGPASRSWTYDIDLLVGLISDQEIDEFVRDAAMRAFICLAADGRIERPFAADFLQRFDEERMAPRAMSPGIRG